MSRFMPEWRQRDREQDKQGRSVWFGEIVGE